MDLNQLKTFCAVVEKKSFTKASEILFLSQPTVSFQVNSLEQELDTRLLDRLGREVKTTRSGEVLYRYARRILQLAHEAEQAVAELKGLIKGSVTLGASTIPGEYILPPLLVEFKKSHPGIEISLIIGDTKGIIRKVTENEVELGVVGTREKSETLAFERFSNEKLVLIAPPDAPWFESNRPVTLRNLINAPYISREIGSGTGATIREKLYEAGIKETDLNIVMKLGSTEAVKKAVESGAGVSLISEKAINNEIKIGSIKKIPIQDFELDRDFYVVYRRHRSHSPAIQAFLQFLDERKGLSFKS